MGFVPMLQVLYRTSKKYALAHANRKEKPYVHDNCYFLHHMLGAFLTRRTQYPGFSSPGNRRNRADCRNPNRSTPSQRRKCHSAHLWMAQPVKSGRKQMSYSELAASSFFALFLLSGWQYIHHKNGDQWSPLHFYI